jgi:hypothetical protein
MLDKILDVLFAIALGVCLCMGLLSYFDVLTK